MSYKYTEVHMRAKQGFASFLLVLVTIAAIRTTALAMTEERAIEPA